MSKARTLREWRMSRFMDQREFSRYLGVKLTTYRSWEQGYSVPRYPMQRHIADTLGISPAEVAYSSSSRSARVAG